MKNKKFIKIFIILFASALILFGIYFFISGEVLKRHCKEETMATIVQIVKSRDTTSDKEKYYYFPVLEYMADNDIHQVKSQSSVSEDKYQVGQKVKIMYNPKRVEEFYIKGEKSYSVSLAVIFMSFGLLGLGFGIYYLKTGHAFYAEIGPDLRKVLKEKCDISI